MARSVLRRIFLFLLLSCQNLLADNTELPAAINFKPLTQQALATYPLFRGDEAFYGGFGAELFTRDSRLFAFLERYEDSLTVIKIWDTLSGELKYQLAAPQEFPLHYDQAFHMQLSPDEKMLTLQMSEGHPASFYTWKFTTMNKLEESCAGVAARNWVQDFADDNALLLVSGTENFEYDFALCQPGIREPVLHAKLEQAKQWWGAHVRLLHNGKMMIIRNVGAISPPQGQPKPGLHKYIAVWNLHYAPAAKKLIRYLKRDKKTLTLVESYENRVCVNRWNYAQRKHLNKTCFPGIQAQQAVFAGNYILLAFADSLTLLEQQDQQLVKRWTKDFSQYYADVRGPASGDTPASNLGQTADIAFSPNQAYIRIYARYYGWRLPSIMVLNTTNGQIREHSVLSDLNKCSDAVVDPAARYMAMSPDCDFLAHKRSVAPQAKSIQRIPVDGHILRVSPDGNILAVRNKGELKLWRHQVTKRKTP